MGSCPVRRSLSRMLTYSDSLVVCRQVEGETGKGAGHGDKEGEFDSTQIVMKRWVEFERERRWKSGTQSRDSIYDLAQRSSSPKRWVFSDMSCADSDVFTAERLAAIGIPSSPQTRPTTPADPTWECTSTARALVP